MTRENKSASEEHQKEKDAKEVATKVDKASNLRNFMVYSKVHKQKNNKAHEEYGYHAVLFSLNPTKPRTKEREKRDRLVPKRNNLKHTDPRNLYQDARRA